MESVSDLTAEGCLDTSSEIVTPDQSAAPDKILSAAPPAGEAEATKPADISKFEKLGLAPTILKALLKAGYTEPTPIQENAIPLALDGRDLMASAQTGTGKTAAFLLPALQKISKASMSNSRGPRVLVLTPTRELALQVTDAAVKYGRNIRPLRIASILGGMPYHRQREQMRGFVDLMVATPGRLIDYLERGELDFSRLELLVLDEADRMLDMGFRDAMKQIVEALPPERQTLLFSATLDKSINDLASGILNNPERLEITPPQARHEQIEQKLHYVIGQQGKRKLLPVLLGDEAVEQAIVFTATKIAADELADELRDAGVKAAALHGDMKQGARNRTIDKLRSRSLRVLVATDVAARGIDVRGISHIINYDLPRAHEDYVHRIGRTGRAGARGIAISLVQPHERGLVRGLERFTGQEIIPFELPGFEVTLYPQRKNERFGNAGPRRFNNRNDGPRFDRNRNDGRGGFGARGDNRGEPRGEYRGGFSGGATRGSDAPPARWNQDDNGESGNRPGAHLHQSSSAAPSGERRERYSGGQQSDRPAGFSRPRSGGYQGARNGERSGGFSGGRSNGAQGGFRGDRSAGYSGERSNGGFGGGHQGDRSGGFSGGRPGGYSSPRGGDRPGGFSGGRGGERSGGFSGGRPGGFSGSRDGGPRHGGGHYSGNRTGGHQGGGYQGGGRPGGGRPGGNRPNR